MENKRKKEDNKYITSPQIRNPSKFEYYFSKMKFEEHMEKEKHLFNHKNVIYPIFDIVQNN